MPQRQTLSRVVLDKRCEVYGQVASLLLDLEEALADDDGYRLRYLLRDLRRTLRSALAFLSPEVFSELESLEGLTELVPSEEGRGLHPKLAEDLTDHLQLLHIKMARVLQLDELEDLEQIVGLPQRLRQRLVTDCRDQDLQARRQEIEDECWRHESEARELIGRQDYARAAKSLRKAIRLDGKRPVFHNDLGVVLSLLGRNLEAISSYQQAVALNEELPQRRTDEWTTSYYNLGIALRKVSADAIKKGQAEPALESLRQAREAFEEYTRLSVSGPKVQDARRVVQAISEQIVALGATPSEAT